MFIIHKKYSYIPVSCVVKNFLLALQIAFFGFMDAFSDAFGVWREARDGVEVRELWFGSDATDIAQSKTSPRGFAHQKK
jgi:hypothetical protein